MGFLTRREGHIVRPSAVHFPLAIAKEETVNKLMRFTIQAFRRMSCEVGSRGRRSILHALLCAALASLTLPCLAQYSANIQGNVLDPSGAGINGAHLSLTNPNTGQKLSAVSDATGIYRFISLAPGQYQLEVQAAGFANTSVTLTLQTNQTLEVPVKLVIASASATVSVTGQAPVLDTAESRNQMTIESDAVATLPLAGRNMISLVTLAPGVTGLGTTGAGSPGSGVDNYSTETQVDSSANGQGAVGNMYIVDGLDITSAIRPGVLNLTPNPDAIQETSIQVNTYSVEYGRASSIQMAMTTKAGTEHFHGNVSDYFNSQQLWAGTEFVKNYAPFHSNNMSATVGGPIIPHHQTFFFFAIEPLRASTSTGNATTTFEDPQFTSWAKANYPNTLGTSILSDYPTSASNVAVLETAQQYFGNDGNGNPLCGTAATNNIPCTLNMLDQGVFNATNYRNGTQWSARVDKSFTNDRIYGSVFRTTLNTGGPALRAAFASTSKYFQYAWQVNEAHTFSPNTLNEAIAGGMRVEGITPASGNFKVPVINVTGLGTGFGNGFALGDFIQHNYHWRDVLTHIQGAHTLKAGYEGWFGDDVEEFQGPYDLPNFSFDNLLQLAQDDPHTEGGVAYNPITGQHVEWNWNAASRTNGLFVQDNWKARKNLTVNFGLRWDDYGNPYSRSAQTVFGNFYMGPGQTIDQEIANGFVLQKTHALSRTITDIFSPRVGIAWDIAGNSEWVLHGGTGIFHNWPTMANVQEQYRGNPPGPIFPTFYRGTDPAPLFVLGTSNTPPFGYEYPALPARSLNAQGGITGLQFGIGGIDPTLRTPVTYIYSAQLEHPLVHSFVASVGYSGSRASDQLSGGGQVYNVSYGVDINSYPGDLIVNNKTVPTRLNQSFGSIYYTQNDRRSDYNAFIADVRGRFAGTGFVDLSYTRSSSKDDTQVYPTWTNPGRYFAPSIWDAPNRISMAGNYAFHGLNNGEGFVGRVTGGWGLSGTMIVQSGTPFTVFTDAPFTPVYDSNGQTVGNTGGDYNADGDNYDYPDVSSYSIPHSRQDFLNGVFKKNPGQVAVPAFGTQGNENYSGFRGPGFFETDASLLKDTTIHDSVGLQMRFEFFNIFNHPNLNGVDSNFASGSFGKSTAQFNPRWIQLGANLTF